ncbi:C40 family peptidase [Christensenella tenuis]|uniref:C40 family peptidase n=1 Tax=Christensenella tenuis TaxID=2763033 RepID=A0ABR7ED32_9FIRM|nr:NlpC/P60 family protein [Christensenella tenuis]MBC5646944.1 C40 family peptidase [Christensenella tenuis]
MKKIICLLAVLSMVVATFAGCGKDGQQQSPEPTETVISNSEQQDEITPTVSPSASVSPTPSASPSASPSSTASKSISGTDGRNGRDGQDGKDGANGEDGRDGADGQTPYIGSNGNWWIGSTDTGVSVTGQGTGGSVRTSLADVPVGTKFPCYPNKEFDWVDGYSGKTVHVNSIVVELTSKNNFDEWATNPDLRTGYSFYSPYTVTAQINGYISGMNSGSVEIVLKSNDNGFAQASSAINNDGTFQVTTQFDDLTRIVDIWFGRASVYSKTPTPTPTPTPEPPVIADVEAFIDVAKAQLDKPYSYGGKGPDSFDASGLVYYALKKSGSNIGFMNLLGWTQDKYYPTVENINDLQRGDFICTNIGMGIYLGNNQMIEASLSQGKVVIVTVDDDIRNNFLCGKRLHAGTDTLSKQSIQEPIQSDNIAVPSASVADTQSPTDAPIPTEAPEAVESSVSLSPEPTAEKSPAPSATATDDTETPV